MSTDKMSSQSLPDAAAEAKRLAKEERRRLYNATKQDHEAKPKATKTERKVSQTKPSPAQASGAITAPPACQPVSPLATCGGLFAHLPPFSKQSSQTLGIKIGAKTLIHPSFIALGLSISKLVISGSNSRSVALLNSLKKLLNDYECPAGKSFSRHFEALLKQHMQFLEKIRPLSVAMRNVAVEMSSAISKLDPSVSNIQAKKELYELIKRYSEERIIFAVNAIVKLAEDKIKEGDVLLIFGRCHLIEEILINAHNKGIAFRVIVVDCGPSFEGRQTLRRLVKECPLLECSYVMIQSITFPMKEVTKVFLGATSMLANGALQGRIGSAVVAVMAQTYHIPCIVCCETRKFSDNAQVDAITMNELCDPDALLARDGQEKLCEKLQECVNSPCFNVLNLAYDITPANLITMVITEVGCIPATSVPIVTREFLKSM